MSHVGVFTIFCHGRTHVVVGLSRSTDGPLIIGYTLVTVSRAPWYLCGGYPLSFSFCMYAWRLGTPTRHTLVCRGHPLFCSFMYFLFFYVTYLFSVSFMLLEVFDLLSAGEFQAPIRAAQN